MVIDARARAGLRSRRCERRSIWHDLECGSYRADLPLWRELRRAAARRRRSSMSAPAAAGCRSLSPRAGHA